jgi:hypothetical protein
MKTTCGSCKQFQGAGIKVKQQPGSKVTEAIDSGFCKMARTKIYIHAGSEGCSLREKEV